MRYMIHFTGAVYSNHLYDRYGRDTFATFEDASEAAADLYGPDGWEIYPYSGRIG